MLDVIMLSILDDLLSIVFRILETTSVCVIISTTTLFDESNETVILSLVILALLTLDNTFDLVLNIIAVFPSLINLIILLH